MDGPSHFDPSATPLPGGLTPPADLPGSLADLRASGWESVSVAEEMRRNTAKAIAAARGGAGRARLRGHRRAPAGERHPGRARPHPPGRAGPGQDACSSARWSACSTSGCPSSPAPRSTTTLPPRPALRPRPRRGAGRSHADRLGAPLAALRREAGHPDTSIADLIGEVDPIKIAEGRYLSDELALHYGLIPRVNRGIFAINELPDLSERIQVGLLNILEERDVQIRGHRIRLPLDIMLVATANPEDYTNRGRIITPLKDRFGAQIRTHYPLETLTEVKIMEARPTCPPRAPVERAAFMKESWPRSASSPGAARTSTSAAASRCASPSPTTRPWSPRPSGEPCAPANRSPCPG